MTAATRYFSLCCWSCERVNGMS